MPHKHLYYFCRALPLLILLVAFALPVAAQTKDSQPMFNIKSVIGDKPKKTMQSRTLSRADEEDAEEKEEEKPAPADNKPEDNAPANDEKAKAETPSKNIWEKYQLLAQGKAPAAESEKAENPDSENPEASTKETSKDSEEKQETTKLEGDEKSDAQNSDKTQSPSANAILEAYKKMQKSNEKIGSRSFKGID